MSIKFTILLYSKYSKFSTNIISTINQYQNIFVENFNMKTLCIDNENIRKRILNSKKINITCVPSILVIYEDGGVEKYENTDAFNWIEEIIKRFMILQKQQEKESQNNIKQEELYFEEDTNTDEPIIDDIPPQQKVKQQTQPKYKKSKINSEPKIQSNKNKQKQTKIPTNKTSIEDLEDLEELDFEDENLQENFEFKPEPIEQIESTNALSEKRNDLLSLAAEMQKSRDSFVENIDKPKNIPFNR
jgi:hypothetical protein